METQNANLGRVKRVIQAPKPEPTKPTTRSKNVSKKNEPALNVDSLRNIACCLCFETKPDVPRVSAFSPFADRAFLSDIIQTCFGVDIDEEHFCTEVCQRCLVRIDITWKFYTQVNANAKALKDLYRSMTIKEELSETCNIKNKQEITKPKKVSGIQSQNVPRYKKQIENTPKTRVANTPIKKEKDIPLEPLISTKREPYTSSDEESDSDSLTEHPFFAENSTSVYNCHLCPQTFDKSQALHVHQLNAHGPGNDQILCHLCAKWFSPRHFNDHVRNIHQDEKCICTVCGQTYSSSTNLIRHMRIHTKERPYKCKLCPYACNQSTALKQHVLRVHMGVKPPSKSKPKKPRKPKVPTYACESCDTTFYHALSLNRHVSRVHMGIKPPPKAQPSDGAPIKARASRLLPCPVCDKSFFLQSKLITHLEETHPDHKANIIQCEDCPERFLRKRGYYNHRLYRHSEKTHKCDHCGEVQPSAPVLYKHKQKCYQSELEAGGSQL
ncbi:AAEL010173-PA [Aedes aegypti]|uniref:AAEL010173-PA n=1 Tax=Aedes aegypti TaxID=7159 RepID=Q16TP8_AEDAE|nr:AAEL010173-PA [Aedes aegypti]